MAAATTVICLLLGFPLALFISRAGSRKNIYLQLVILPFWTSFLVQEQPRVQPHQEAGQEHLSATCDSAVLDQLPGAVVRVAVPAARYRIDQHRAAAPRPDSRSAAASV